jgi:hypothetical protein
MNDYAIASSTRMMVSFIFVGVIIAIDIFIFTYLRCFAFTVGT